MAASPSSRSTTQRPLYAIDFTAVACGKRIANTKRRVRWRFGFANPDALAAGETGTACRGEEHDITLVWSVTSGKRLILADGQEVHYSNSRSAVIDFSWTMRGNHVLKVVAHATAPMSVDPGFRQYDFFVDGRSFFTFPKVYRLGLTGGRTLSPNADGGVVTNGRMAESSERRSRGDIAAIEAPHNPDEEEAYLREAIKASLAEEQARTQKIPEGGQGSGEKKMSSEAADLLIDFMDDFASSGNTLPPAAAPAVDNWAITPAPQQNNQWAQQAASAVPNNNNWMSAVASQPPQQYAPAPPAPSDPFGGSYMAASPPNFASPPPQQSPMQSQTAPAPYGDPFASQSFAQPPAAPMPAPAPPAYGQDPFATPAPPASDPFAPQSTAPAPSAFATSAPPSQQQPTANLTMNSLNGANGLLGTSNGGGSGGTMADKALQNLMGSIDNFGITGAAAKPPANNPFDNNNNIVSNATLGEIKNAKSTGEKKPVMNAPPGGALVPVANQGGNWGGYGQQNQSQYGGMGGSMPPQYTMSGGYGQQQMGYGQGMQQQQQQPMMGQSMNQQQPPMGMGQSMNQQQPPQWGQQQQPQPQPPNWGAPSYQ